MYLFIDQYIYVYLYICIYMYISLPIQLTGRDQSPVWDIKAQMGCKFKVQKLKKIGFEIFLYILFVYQMQQLLVKKVFYMSIIFKIYP